MARWMPHGGPPAAHYYKCKICGYVCFDLKAMNCPTCGHPFVKYDRQMRVMYGQLSFEELKVVPVMKKKVSI